MSLIKVLIDLQVLDKQSRQNQILKQNKDLEEKMVKGKKWK